MAAQLLFWSTDLSFSAGSTIKYDCGHTCQEYISLNGSYFDEICPPSEFKGIYYFPRCERNTSKPSTISVPFLSRTSEAGNIILDLVTGKLPFPASPVEGNKLFNFTSTIINFTYLESLWLCDWLDLCSIYEERIVLYSGANGAKRFYANISNKTHLHLKKHNIAGLFPVLLTYQGL